MSTPDERSKLWLSYNHDLKQLNISNEYFDISSEHFNNIYKRFVVFFSIFYISFFHVAA